MCLFFHGVLLLLLIVKGTSTVKHVIQSSAQRVGSDILYAVCIFSCT